MHRRAQYRPCFRQLVLATAVASLPAVIVATTATAAPTTAVDAAEPIPPGSFALALHAQGSPLAQAQAGDGITAAAEGTICFFGACYNYVAGRQLASSATGASVQLFRARPGLDPTDSNAHSLHELAVQSTDGRQIVEIGWTVDPGVNGDFAPHLFVFHWVDGIPTCYNGCGFVRTSSRVAPGMTLTTGGLSTFRIEHVGNRWQLSLDGTMFGFFPDSLWSTAFTQPLQIQTFGEVASTSTPTCNQMGTGRFAESRGSSQIANFTLLGPTPTPVNLTMLVTTPEWYDAARVTPSGFRLGGPGAGQCAR